MSHKLINQSGIINLPYQVIIESEPTFVSLSIYVTLPDAPPTFLDIVTAFIDVNTSNAILEVYLKAEEKWGIDFIKYQPEILTQ